jgi:acetyl esterase/lipase
MVGAKNRRAKCLDDLAQSLRRYTDSCATTNPYQTAIDGFVILRSDQPKLPSYRLFRPALCIAVQGTKWATFGDRRYEYAPARRWLSQSKCHHAAPSLRQAPASPFLAS